MHASAASRSLLHGGLAAALLALSLAGCPAEIVIMPPDPDAGTPVDDDCDGLANEEGNDCACKPATPPANATLWSKRFGDASSQTSTATAVDGAGNILLTGFFSGSVDFDGGPLPSAGEHDIFVAKLDPSGNHLWSKRFGDVAQQYVGAIAVDAAGDVLFTGNFDGTVDFGGGAFKSAGDGDMFVAKLDPSGNHLWSKRFGDAAQQYGGTVAVDVAGDVLLSGFFLPVPRRCRAT